jgi:flagellum-specific peptidoglycan hydrolase FlgJ
MNEAQNTFLRTTAIAAMESQRQTGVPASITIAQAILESGWGRSGLAIKGNNYFGIKDTDKYDGYVEFTTTEFAHGKAKHEFARFEKYPSVADCFAHHARLISQSQRYQPAMKVRNNPEKFARALQVCGYSTSPTYAEALMQLVHQFNLTQFDSSPEPPAQAKEKAA